MCYIGADNAPYKVNAYIVPGKPYEISCKYEDVSASIPKFLQFTVRGDAASLHVQINLSDGTQTQVINKEVQLNGSTFLYEVPVLAYVNDALMQTGKAHIKSIVISNSDNAEVLLADISFSNTSAKYEVKMNQVFTVDLTEGAPKNYFMSAPTFKMVNINLYKTNGEFFQQISRELTRGDNYLHFEQLDLRDGKYVVVITENDIKKAPGSRITVMN